MRVAALSSEAERHHLDLMVLFRLETWGISSLRDARRGYLSSHLAPHRQVILLHIERMTSSVTSINCSSVALASHQRLQVVTEIFLRDNLSRNPVVSIADVRRFE